MAHGIALLAQIAGQLANVRVVAPERDRSGVSNALTLDRPLRLRQAENGFYFVSGTPADCIHIALHAMPEFKPDLILSGINHGANMGDDTLYSGTIAAATEAYLLGIPAVAFSLNDKQNRYWDTAEYVVSRLLSYLLSRTPLPPILWNINIPPRTKAQLRGWRVTRLGRRHHEQCVTSVLSPRGEQMYWIGAAGAAADCDQGTDFAENAAGSVTLTPLSVDLTATNQMSTIQQFWQDICL